MRFRTPVPFAEILGPVRPFLISGVPLPENPPPVVSGLDSPEFSGPESLTFLADRTPLRVLALFAAEAQGAGIIVAEPGVAIGGSTPILRVHSIHAAMAALLRFHRDRLVRIPPFAPGGNNLVSPRAVVEGCLEGGVTVGAGAVVSAGAYIGTGTVIEPNAVVHPHVEIGRNCRIQAGAVIGCDGFGFFSGPAGMEAMPHPAGVVVSDDCWIGANAVVAAGVLHPTSLGRGCKLDSHVQIAHNVTLGPGSLLASQSGVAGSTTIGKGFRMGGAASVDGHLRIGDDVSVAACSAVTKDLPDHAVVAGFPAQPIFEWRRQQVMLRRLGTKEEP